MALTSFSQPPQQMKKGLALDDLLDRGTHPTLAEVLAADRANHLGERELLVLGGQLLDLHDLFRSERDRLGLFSLGGDLGCLDRGRSAGWWSGCRFHHNPPERQGSRWSSQVGGSKSSVTSLEASRSSVQPEGNDEVPPGPSDCKGLTSDRQVRGPDVGSPRMRPQTLRDSSPILILRVSGSWSRATISAGGASVIWLPQGGNHPNNSSARRIRTRRGWLRSRAEIVARPCADWPTRSDPSQRKCSGQRSCLGWKRRTMEPSSGSGKPNAIRLVQVASRATPSQVLEIPRSTP